MAKKAARKAKKKTVAKKRTVAKRKSRKPTLKKKVQTDLAPREGTATNVKADYVFRADYAVTPDVITPAAITKVQPRPQF